MAPFDLDACIEQLMQKRLLHEALLREICEKTKEVLMRESNVVHVSAPVTVVGDIHGQFYDLIEIFRIGGYPPDTNYLFLGDYVDRGLFSVETISLLTCLKLRYPDRVQLIRGNHESRAVTQNYGFYRECTTKYGSGNVWTYFTDMFDFLTLSVVIDDRIFCVHGGLSPSIHSIDQIKVMDRFREIPHEGPMADLVWSDPDPEKEDFAISPRGAGYTFGSGVVHKFLQENNMNHILRAHQLCMEGYSSLFDKHLSTVWSAPNYCYRCGNSASILEVGPGGSMFFNVFEAAPENERDGLIQHQQQQSGQGGPAPELASAEAASTTAKVPPQIGVIQGAHDFQLNHSNVSVIGGDSHAHTHVHYYGLKDSDLTVKVKAVLDVVYNFRKIQQDTLGKATPGTVKWLFVSKYFSAWWSGNGNIQILWGSGIPGAGKTIVASLVIDEIEQRAAEPTTKICVAYFYMRYSEHGEVTVRAVLEVLVKQSLERHESLLPFAKQAYARHIREGTQPTEAQLLDLLEQFNAHMAITFYILDALDEAPMDIQHDLIEKLASLNARLFVTSRPMQDVQASFPEAHRFEIAACDRDLDLHIAKKLQSIPRLRALLEQGKVSVKEQVMTTVKSKCGGMFLHASLQLDALQTCLNVRSVLQTLARFPAKIEDVYTQTWERIVNKEPDHVTLAKLALVWVLYARRSLTIGELCHAIATCPETHSFDSERIVPESTITDLCYGLLTVDKESRLVRLVHYTAKQPMEDLLRISFPHPQSVLAAVCMARLTDCGFQNITLASNWALKTALEADPLLDYAYDAWAFHAQESSDMGSVARQISTFIRGCRTFPVVLDSYYSAFPSFDSLGPLHVAAFYNFPMSLAGPPDVQDVNTQTTQCGRTPLHLACSREHGAAAKNLLCLPNILANIKDNAGETALMHACRKGYEGIVKLLLAHRHIDVNLVDNDKWTSLMLASGASNGSIVKLLLDHPGTETNAATPGGSTALMMACRGGDTYIVELLLAVPAINVNAVNSRNDTAIKIAVGEGDEDIIRLLCQVPGIVRNTAEEQVKRYTIIKPSRQLEFPVYSSNSALLGT